MKGKQTLCAALLLAGSLLLLQGCARPQAALPAASAVADSVLAAQAFSEPYQIKADKMREFLAIQTGDTVDSAMVMDVSRVTPECVIILTAASDSAAISVEQALKNYRQSLKDQYVSYRPDEVYKIDEAILDAKGLQYALIISPSPQLALEALKTAWK